MPAGHDKLEKVLSALIDRTKFAYVPLEYYDVDRQIAPMLPDHLTLGRLFVPFDLVSRTIMVACCNPFDAAGREAVQQSLDYTVAWYLARPARDRQKPCRTFTGWRAAAKRATDMRSKSFGERIADVLIEDGLLLPNQLEEAVAIQKKRRRPAAQDFDRQAIRHRTGHGLQHGPLPEYAADQSVEVARAGRDHVAGAARHGEGEQAGADRATERQTFRGDGRPDQRARGRRPEAAGAAGNRSDDRDREGGHAKRSPACTAART